MACSRLLKTTTSIVLPVSVWRTVIFSLFIVSPSDNSEAVEFNNCQYQAQAAQRGRQKLV
jgi:hypothetical protein